MYLSAPSHPRANRLPQRRYRSYRPRRHGKSRPHRSKQYAHRCVQGQNLVLNMNDKGFTVAVYNRTESKIPEFLNNEAKGTLHARQAG